MSATKNTFKYVVLGFDVLIKYPKILAPEKDTPKVSDNLVIPRQYLDEFYEIYNEQSIYGDASKRVTAILTSLIIDSKKHNEYELANGTVLHIYKPDRKTENDMPAHFAINTANHFKNGKGGSRSTAVMTGSSRLELLVLAENIEVLEFKRKSFTGRRTLRLRFEDSNEWYSNHKIDNELFAIMYPEEDPLMPNEFVEFELGPNETKKAGDFSHIGRYDPFRKAIIPLKRTNELPYGIRPRNAGQAMLVEALMMPPDEMPLVIVQGTFGTGKTFLTLAAGITQTEGNGHKPIYDKVFICPRDSYLGREHGYLKGDLMEKLMPLLGSIKDNLLQFLKTRGKNADGKNGKAKTFNEEIMDYFANDGTKPFEFDAIINMGGRSINDSFVIYDEFQDVSWGQAYELLTRLGDRSKNVVMGDPSQFTNPHLSKTNNGLIYAVDIFKEYEGAAIITMLPHEVVRSAAGLAMAQMLKDRY